MSYDLLSVVRRTLTVAQIPTQEEYPGLEQPEIDSPRAALGLRELDAAGGIARFRVKILSPRILGSWCCQVWGARAVWALYHAGMACRTEEMKYLSGSDCFCVTVEAEMTVVRRGDDWEQGNRWRISCDGSPELGIRSFTASRDQQRRVVGTHWKSEPVSISPGTGGWKLELVQDVSEEPASVTEPFVMRVRDGNRECRYTGCCWNETIWEYTQAGTRLTRRGFALGREELADG